MKVFQRIVLQAICDRCEITEQAAYAVDDVKALANFRAWLVELGWMVGELGLCVECHAMAKQRKGAA